MTKESRQPLSKANSVVAFIDILGFKEIVKANEKSKNDDIIYELQLALEQAYKKSITITSHWLDNLGKLDNDLFKIKLKHKQFSDNIYVSFDFKDDNSDYEVAVYLIIIISAIYQKIMLTKGFYVRGGIALGTAYFDENMIFSNALIKAYDIESKIAKYPRIVIDDEVIKQFNKVSKQNIIRTHLPKFIVKDWTNVAFLNPFKFMESFQTMFTQNPEIIPILEKIIIDHPKLLEDASTLERELTDKELTELVKSKLRFELKKHKKEKDIYEKFLWLREFVAWQDNNKNTLDFKYYK
jgi:hypothetical protein